MKWLVVTAIAFMSCAAVAGDGQQLNISPAQTRFFKDSTGYHIASQDGREMTIYEYVRPPQNLKITLKQIENTCNPDQELAECDFHLDFAPFHYLLIWTKHSDASKIGTLVENGKISQSIGYYNTFKFPALASLFSPDRLSCSNYAWTEGMKKTASGSLIVDSWSAELMFENFESNINENQTLANGFEVLLKPNINKDLEVEGVKSDYQAFEADSPPYISSQVSNLSFVSTKNETCQVSFESNVGNAVSALRSSYYSDVDMRNIKPATDIVPALYMQFKNKIQAQMQSLTSTSSGGKP